MKGKFITLEGPDGSGKTANEFKRIIKERFPNIEIFETSAENMAIWLFTSIKNETNLPIIKIELAETKSSNIIYEP